MTDEDLRGKTPIELTELAAGLVQRAADAAEQPAVLVEEAAFGRVTGDHAPAMFSCDAEAGRLVFGVCSVNPCAPLPSGYWR